MKRNLYEGRNLVEGKNYTLVGKERYRNGYICYFVFNEDTIEGTGVVGLFLFKEFFTYDDLIVGDDYRITREGGLFNFSETCRNILNIKL